MSGVRMLGGWLVGGFFGILAIGALAAGDGVSGTVRGVLAAAILLAAAGLAILRTRARIGDASGRTVSTRLVAALLVVGLVAGIGVAPAVDPGAGPGTDGENADNALEEPDETGGDGLDPGGEETATGTDTETQRTESAIETDASAETGTPTETPAETDGEATTRTDTETPTDSPDGELRVRYLDVGQVDATVVEFPNGETMVVDSGDWRDDRERVLTPLRERGIERIDHLVSTHAHADHIGGHEAVIEAYETDHDGVSAVYDSGVVLVVTTDGRELSAAPETEFSTDPDDFWEERSEGSKRRGLVDPTIDARAVPTTP